MCPVVNCTGECVGITNFTVKPLHGHVGDTLHAIADFQVYQPIGTGP